LSKRQFPFDDFEAVIRIFSAVEGGRSTPLFNGIRCDFEYAEDPIHDTLYMIHPDFIDEKGNSRRNSFPLPIGENLPARMMIVSDELREQVHRKRIVPGVRFYCREGPRRIAEGVVTRITGLFEPRPNRD